MVLKAHFNRIALLAVFAVSSAVNAAPQTNDLSVEQIKLKDLRTSKPTVTYSKDKPTVLMIFQPDCPWCKKQGAIIGELQHECGDKVHFGLVGDNGSKRELKRDLRHFSAQLDSQQSSSIFIRHSGGVKGYPTTLVVDTEGHILAKRRGFTSEKLLRRLTSQLSNGECAIQ